ncbi:hypothetical protein [Streptomyces sp. NPDC058326]|uniref:hypothetical protein n=1 Tax=Streptomyces sp. NPDC058326 TaxID=3346447 RepID=UPI0036E23D4E
MTGKTRARSGPNGTAGGDRPYPCFTGGQVLTHQDLNQLRDFLDGQDRLLGQAIGFGITAGLTGTVSTPDAEGKRQFTVDPGLGIDQPGQVLWLGTAVQWPDLAKAIEEAHAAPPLETPFDFIEAGPGGTTPVLVLDDKDKGVPQCGETDCAGHSALKLRVAEVLLVPGRLKSTAADFATEPLLDEAPLTIQANGDVGGDFDQLRNAVSARLNAVGIELSAAAAQRLSGLALTTSTPLAVGQYRAAFLNHVFFATLDLLRVRALHTPTSRATTRPGIALGWLATEGGVHVWKPAYRHDFEPPVGLANALTGAGPLDAVAQMRNRLESLLLSYNEPTVPGPEVPMKPPPGKGDFHVCPKGEKSLARLRMLLGVKNPCFDVYFPPSKLPDKWRDFYLEEAPFIKGPGHGLMDPVGIDVLYGTDPLDFAQAGVFSLGPALGASAAATAESLKAFITDQGLSPDVQVLTADQARQLKGFSVQGAISLGDKLVLVHDQAGRVVEVGRVPNQQALKSAGGVLAEAVNAAAGAQQAAQEVAGVQTAVQELKTSLSQLKVSDTTQLQQLATLTARVENVVVKDDLIQLRKDLKGEIAYAHQQASALQQKVIDAAAQVAGLWNEHTNLKEDVALSLELVKKNDGRVDHLFQYGTSRFASSESFVPLLGDFLDTLSGALAGAESSPAVSGSEELVALVEALVAAAEAADRPEAELTRVRHSARTLTALLRQGPS